MSHYASTCMFSTVKNTSGLAKTFGFLPPHGKKLAANEEFSVFGQITEAIQRDGYGVSRRYMQAFEAAMSRGDIQIVSTPNPILEDEHGLVQMIVLKDGALAAFEPCWDSYASPTDPVL